MKGGGIFLMPKVAETWKHEYLNAGGIRFHCITEAAAPLGARFKVVAPDLRGYNLTEREGPYDIKTLCADVMGLIRAYGREQAVVAGHDWGAIILWNFALEYPDALSRLVALNVPF